MAIESESNNSRTSANLLITGIPITGSLSNATDIDFYKISLNKPGYLYFYFDIPYVIYSSRDYFRIKVYDGGGALIEDKNVTGYDDILLKFNIIGSGDCFISVESPTYWTSSKYTLTASIIEGSGFKEEIETNNSTLTANPVNLNETIIGQLSYNDSDYYKVLLFPGILNIELDVPTNEASSYFTISLLDSAYNVLARYFTGKDANYSVQVDTIGAYYVLVEDATNWNAGLYSLKFSNSFNNLANYEFESNNSFNFANPINLGSTIKGQLLSNSDVDYYKVIVNDSGIITLNFDSSIESYSDDYFKISFSNIDLSLVGTKINRYSFEDSIWYKTVYRTGSDNNYSFAVDRAGTYLIGIRSGSTYSSSDYFLSPNFNPSNIKNLEFEYNDSILSANNIDISSSIFGQLANYKDSDFFKFKVITSAPYFINFDSPIESNTFDYFNIILYDNNSKIIANYKTGSDKSFPLGSLSPADYFIQISNAANSSNNTIIMQGSQDYVFQISTSPFGIRVTGTNGSDSLIGTTGNDLIDGGSGIDTLKYSGLKANYQLAKTTSGFTVTSAADGVDTILNIERLNFLDVSIALDLSGNAGVTAKILGSIFGKESISNKNYVGIGLNYLDKGWTYDNLAALALDAAGAKTKDQIVSLLWKNVIGTSPTVADKQPYIALLENGMTAGALAHLAADSSYNTTNINLVGLAQTGIEYIPLS